MNVLTVVGARPQFVKASVVSRALAGLMITEKIVHTGQHYDENMSESFFRELEIPEPAYNLGVGGGGHGEQTGRMMIALEEVFVKEAPDWVLVYGDTNSTLAGALVAAKLHIPVAHVEAGLRSYDRKMPEEVNRVVTDHVSDVLFAPTEVAVKNLADEGVSGDKVHVTGDVMYDVALAYRKRAEELSSVMDRLGLEAKKFVLATVHRAENTDDPAKLTAIMDGLSCVGKVLPVVLPLHPRTAKALGDKDLGAAYPGIRFIEPVGYLDMLTLTQHAAVVATDSGGVQKEAFFQGTPCVTMRRGTEWTELVDSGWNTILPPTSSQAVAEGVRSAVGRKGEEMRAYGEGDAAVKIAKVLTGGLN